MSHLNLDYVLVYSFLLITLVVGVRASHGITNMRAYAVANKSFGTLALVLTYLATNIAGASVFNITGIIFADGVIITAALLALPATFLFRAFFVAPHAVRFPKCLTMGDLVGTLYGPTSKLIAGLLGLFTAFCIATMELSMLGEVGQSLLGWPRQGTIVVGGVLLACYTAYGGIKSVTATDVFQFLVLLVGIPILAIITVEEAGGMKQVFAQVPTERLQVFTHPQFTRYLAMALIWLIPLGMVDPCIMQRMFMGKTRKQLRDQYLIVAVFDPALQLTLMLIGLAGIVLYPHIKGIQVIPHIVQHLIPTGLKGVIMAGLLGIVISTIDSYLHAMGLTAVHDLLQPVLGTRLKENVEIRYIRYATVLLSCVAIYTALYTSNFLGLLLLSLEVAGPLLMCPIIAGMMGVKPDKHAFYGAMGVTLCGLIVSKSVFAAGQDHWVAFTGAVTNGLSFFAIHWVRNKGLALVSWEQGVAYSYTPQKETRWRRIKQLIPTPSRVVAYSQQQVAKYGAPYTILGVFCCLNYTFPYFMWQHETISLYETMLYLRVCGAVLCGLLVVKDKWPTAYLAYLPTFWHLTLLYCLPFTSTVMFLLTQGSVEWLINVAITIMLLIVLVDWRSFVWLTLLGIGLGGAFYRLTLGPIHLQLDFSTGYLLVYQGFFATLIGLLFARRKQQHFDILSIQRMQLAQDHQEAQAALLSATKTQVRFAHVLKKAGIEDLASIAHLSKQLLAASKQASNGKKLVDLAQKLTDQLTPMALRVDKLSHRTLGFLRLKDVQTLPLHVFLHTLQQAFREKDQKISIVSHTQHTMLQCDVTNMIKVMVNSYALIRSVAGESASVLLVLEDTQLSYQLETVQEAHTKQIDALRFTITATAHSPELEQQYVSQVREEELTIPAGPEDLPLIANERIVKAHYGYSSAMHQEAGLTLLYVIPVRLREVRSPDMDLPHPHIQGGAEWPRANDQYPGAQAQEQAFLQAVKEKTHADLARIRKAIDVIKDYHGPVMRQSGEPFYLHPMAVAQIVLDYVPDEATVLGALLHDIVEDTPMTLEQIALLFNHKIAAIVNGVTHMESNEETIYKVLLSHPENIHRLLGTEDPRVLYVKLADRMHNMRTIAAKSRKSQRRTAEETLLFFVPLAKYLGLMAAAEELRTLSFGVLGKEGALKYT